MDKIVFHIDVNSAFLSWEAVYRLHHKGGSLDLRQIPSAVGGDIAMRRGIILAKSLPAKKYGIKTGESIPEARKKCPALVLVPPNYGIYQEASTAFMNLLREYSPKVEPYSVDEAFVDMTETSHLFGGALPAAEQIKNRIRDELGFTVNVGVSTNKLLAKMASDFKGPDKVHTLFPEEIEEKMWPLPVSELFFVGRATTAKLLSMGIKTIGELAGTDVVMLKTHLKKQGEVIWGFANGIDVSEVQEELPPNKGYGNSTTIAFDVTDAFTAHHILLALSETVGTRLRADEVKAEVVTVGIKESDFTHTSHQKVLGSATNITAEIFQAASELFDEMWKGTPIRQLGVYTGRIRQGEFTRQLGLFDEINYEKLEKLDAAVDAVRQRYGIDALKRAVFTRPEQSKYETILKREHLIDHMSGGISREKRTVDYSKVNID